MAKRSGTRTKTPSIPFEFFTRSTTRMAFDLPVTNFSIDENWVVTADCEDSAGNVHTRSFNLKDYVGCDSEGILRSAYAEANVKEFWDPSWPVPTITPEGELHWTGPELTPGGALRAPTTSRMSEYVNNPAGRYSLPVPDVETTTMIPIEHERSFMLQLSEILNKEGSFVEYTTHPTQEGVTVFYAKAGASVGGYWFKTFSAEAKASVIELSAASNVLFLIILFKLTPHGVSQGAGTGITEVEFSILAAKAGAHFGAYIGADLSFNLAVGRVSIFDAQLGVGISTGFGLRDEALEVKALGIGFTVGKRIGISIFDNSFEINFTRLF